MDQNIPENRVLGQLQRVVSVTTQRMFGCIGVYSGAVFFAIIDGACLYFKVDAQNRAGYEAHGIQPFAPYANGKPIPSFYQVPHEVLDEPDMLRNWAAAAIAAANRKKGPGGRSRRTVPDPPL